MDDAIKRSYNILLSLSLIGLSLVFVGIFVSYVYSLSIVPYAKVYVPNIFLFTSAILFLNSFFLKRIEKGLERNDKHSSQWYLFAFSALLLFFCIGQIMGFRAFYHSMSDTLRHSASYLYLLAGLHLLHVLIVFPILVWFYSKFLKTNKAYSQSSHSKILFFYTLFMKYWRFVSVLWIGLIILLMFNNFMA